MAYRHPSFGTLRTATAAFALMTLLAGCSSEEAPIMPGYGAAPMPPSAATGAAPADAERDPLPAEILRQMDPTEGLSFKPLFDQPAPDDDARMKRIENAVEILRNDLDNAVIPSVLKLVAAKKADQRAAAEAAAEAERQAQVQAEQQKALEAAQAAGTAPAADVAAGAGNTAPQMPVAVTADKNASITAVRIGDHADKTRVVLDVTAKGEFPVAMAYEGTQLVVNLGPQFAWTAPAAWEAKTANPKLVSAWKYADGKFTADLLSAAVVKSATVLPAVQGGGYRLVIDLHSKDVHR